MTLFDFAAFTEKSAKKAANELLKECMKQFTKIIDCSAPPNCGSAFLDVHDTPLKGTMAP